MGHVLIRKAHWNELRFTCFIIWWGKTVLKVYPNPWAGDVTLSWLDFQNMTNISTIVWIVILWEVSSNALYFQEIQVYETQKVRHFLTIPCW